MMANLSCSIEVFDVETIEFLSDLIANPSEFVYDEFFGAGGMRRIIEPDVQPVVYLTCKCRATFVGTATYRDHVIPRFLQVLVYVFGIMGADVDAGLSHNLYGLCIDLGCRFGSCGVNFQVSVKRLEAAVCHLTATTISGTEN